jgi:hypothetical protein
VIAWIGRVAAFLYIAFYAVTDHIAGIGNGVVMQQSGASSTSERPEIGWLFGVANDVGGAGAWALAWRRSRPRWWQFATAVGASHRPAFSTHFNEVSADRRGRDEHTGN